jgi:hypothetical protein
VVERSTTPLGDIRVELRAVIQPKIVVVTKIPGQRPCGPLTLAYPNYLLLLRPVARGGGGALHRSTASIVWYGVGT